MEQGAGGLAISNPEFRTEEFVLTADEAQRAPGSADIILRGNVRMKLLKPSVVK